MRNSPPPYEQCILIRWRCSLSRWCWFRVQLSVAIAHFRFRCDERWRMQYFVGKLSWKTNVFEKAFEFPELETLATVETKMRVSKSFQNWTPTSPTPSKKTRSKLRNDPQPCLPIRINPHHANWIRMTGQQIPITHTIMDVPIIFPTEWTNSIVAKWIQRDHQMTTIIAKTNWNEW